jgi:hypothetical protein
MSTIVKDSNGQFLPTIFTPGVSQVMSVTNSSVQTSAFGASTTIVMVTCSQGHGHIAFGANPTANTTTTAMIPNNSVLFFSVTPGNKAAVIKDATVTSCTICVTELI